MKKLFIVFIPMVMIGCNDFSKNEQSKIDYRIINETEFKIDSIRIDFCDNPAYSMNNIDEMDSIFISLDSDDKNICHEGNSSVNIYCTDTTFIFGSGYHPPMYNSAMIHISPDSIYSNFTINEEYY